jgi:hypothetical protein
MSPKRAYYVTACQQLLALGVVVMALVPATRVVSLDVVGVGPGEGVATPRIAVSPDQPAVVRPEAGAPGYARSGPRCAARGVRVAERQLSGDQAPTSCRKAGRIGRAGAG